MTDVSLTVRVKELKVRAIPLAMKDTFSNMINIEIVDVFLVTVEIF